MMGELVRVIEADLKSFQEIQLGIVVLASWAGFKWVALQQAAELDALEPAVMEAQSALVTRPNLGLRLPQTFIHNHKHNGRTRHLRKQR